MDGREDDAERRRPNRQGGQPMVFVLHRHRAGTCARREQVREMDVLLQRYRVRGGSLPQGGPRNGRRGMQAQLIRVRYRERQRRRLLLPELDDVEAHRRVVAFMLEHGLVRKTKSGKLYNIGFKLDDQARAGEYGAGFKARITLSDRSN